jgi:hypothetical protein
VGSAGIKENEMKTIKTQKQLSGQKFLYCNKTLTHNDGTTSFKRGKKYKLLNIESNNPLTVALQNEQGENHQIVTGGWLDNFSITDKKDKP